MKTATLTRFALLSAALLTGCTAWSQTTGDASVEEVRRELQRVREEYERRIRQLEQRLDELETATKTTVATPPPLSPAQGTGGVLPEPGQGLAHPASVTPGVVATTATTAESPARAAAVAGQFRENTESIYRSLSLDQNDPVAKRLQEVMSGFLDISGYFRAGYGRNDRGGVQVPFMAPGAPAKYRLGNETEVYGELAFGKNFYLGDVFAPDRTPAGADPQTLQGPIARVQVRPSYSLTYSGDSAWALPEAWAAIGNVVAGKPDLKFWAGNRFYRRYDVHINDWYFYNMSGLGGGIEDLDLGFGKAAVAWLGNSSGSAAYTDVILDEAANRSGFAKSSFDFRLYDVALPLGKGEFGMTYASTEGGEGTLNGVDRFTVPGADGFSFHALHLATKFLDERSVNKLAIQGGWGAAKNLSSGLEIFDLGGVNYITPELPDAWRIRVNEDFILQPTERFSIAAVVGFQYTDYDHLPVPGLPGGVYGGQRYWYTAGTRPVLHFTRNLSLAVEGGVDYTDTIGLVDAASNLHGTLWKVTVAPQVSIGRHFMSRPVIRLYFTYAGWLDGFEGVVGGPIYADRDYGYAGGVQMEAWW